MPRAAGIPAGRIALRLAPVFLGLLVLSCASSNSMTRKSEKSLAEGQTRRAYDWARRALDKDPRNDQARANMRTAATNLSAEWKQRIRDMAAADSLGAADECIEFARFRAELARYEVVLPQDPAFREDEILIRSAAAAHAYRAGMIALDAGQPKAAYRSLVDAGQYVPGYRDLATRIPRVYEMAITRVAILPFANQTDVPGLSKTIADQIYGEVDDRMNPKQFQFLRLLDTEDVYSKMTVSQLERLDRQQAIGIGRQLGARCVIWGSFSGLDAHSTTGLYHQSIYRHVIDPDPTVKDRDRYDETNFTAVTRQRDVKVHCQFEVVDVATGESLDHYGDDMRAVANTYYSLFFARGDISDYYLLPPAVRRSDANRATAVDKEWAATFGSLSLSKVLLTVREGAKSRTRYRPEYRAEFLRSSYLFPVLLDDLPTPNDMAVMALGNAWKPVHESLKQVDDQDLAPVPAVTSRQR